MDKHKSLWKFNEIGYFVVRVYVFMRMLHSADEEVSTKRLS